ncbi:helix-turn-helix transcriptional regulator [Streptomyces sp. 769]|uniref:helix-turn-helix domain-containing protein n=1 Tax=Streptomyces sp. 769 TaxID=1262452 RepID=UPI00057CF49A|nr:helix-turn-helix transcriptional regulator [Streptomyces sp. 769]AJC53951.1 XRE family transcriptional regulator [Streptomyces sp. 769]
MSNQAEAARTALGARLRGFRKDAGFTSGRAFAHATGWQESKVSRIENGKQNVSEEDIRTWCETTNRQDHVADLIATLRHIDELWLEWKRQFQDGAAPTQKRFLSLYSKTKVFRIWHPTVVWGTIQTADYSADIFNQVISLYGTPDDADAAVAKRLERQQHLYAGDKVFNVLLAEQALHTNFGGPEVMKGQLDRLLAVMRLPRLSLGIIPRDARMHVWPGNSFSIFDDKVVHVETYSAEMTVTQPNEIEIYFKVFELLRQSAVYGGEVRELIRAAFQHYDRMSSQQEG